MKIRIISKISSLFDEKTIYLLRLIKVRYYKAAFPVVLFSLVAFIEISALSFFAPITKGLTEGNFHFLSEIKVVAYITSLLPDGVSLGNRFYFSLLISVFTLLMILRYMVSFWASFLVEKQTLTYQKLMRTQVFKRILSFNMGYIDGASKGRLNALLMQSSDQFVLIIGSFQKILGSLSNLILLMIAMFCISWRLAIIVVLLLPFMRLMTHWILVRARFAAKKSTQFNLQLGKKIYNILDCIELVKANSDGKNEVEWFNQTNENIFFHTLSRDKKRLLLRPIQELALLFITVVLLVAISYMSVKSIGSGLEAYVVFVILLRRAASHIPFITRISAQVVMSSGHAHYLHKLFNEDNSCLERSGGDLVPDIRSSIRVKKLSFSYSGPKKILNNISFDIHKGHVVALIGPTGSGKSTILRILMGYYQVESGCIFFDDKDINILNPNSLRSQIAWVPQEIRMFDASLKFNLLYGLTRSVGDEEIDNALRMSNLLDLVERLPKGLDTDFGENGTQFSGGERQLFSIARAYLRQSDLLILDEPTSSLDPKTEVLVQKSLNRLMEGKTVLVVAHRLSTIKHCDTIIVLNEGNIEEQGDFSSLMEKKGYFFSSWNAQQFY